MPATPTTPKTPRTPQTPKKAGQSIVLITGANAGLGHFTALSLVKKPGAIVVLLACRDLDAAKESKQDLLRLTGCSDEQVIVLGVPLDLADLSSVRSYAAAVIEWLGPTRKLTALVNNAGVGASPWGTRHHPTSCSELCFATNHLGASSSQQTPRLTGIHTSFRLSVSVRASRAAAPVLCWERKDQPATSVDPCSHRPFPADRAAAAGDHDEDRERLERGA